jgi:hypothetical protein
VGRINVIGYWAPVTTGADLAENYYSDDKTLKPGDIVSLDKDFEGGVRRSSGKGDSHVIGVISTQPGIVLDEIHDPNKGVQVLDEKYAGKVPVAVALAGRIPVNVSIENGPIKPGDYLTQSSTPGVAMKATKAGKVIGQALFGHDKEEIGAVMMFVNNTYYQGASLDTLLVDGLAMDGAEEESTLSQSRQALAYFMSQRDALIQEEVDLSEILTDRLVAGLEIITPKVTTQELAVDTITPSLTQNIDMEKFA